MPKFLSDLEVQGKINAASAEIEDLIVDGNATFHGAPVFDEGMPDFKQGFCIDSAYRFYRLPGYEECGVYLDAGITFSSDGDPTKSILFFSEGEKTAVSVLGDFCVNGSFCLMCGTFAADALSVYCGEFSSLLTNDFCAKQADLCYITASQACISGNLLVGETAIVGGVHSAYCINALPLCSSTVLGACAYGLSVSKEGGLQLWGTHFLRGSVWSNDTLKIVHNDLSLGATDKAFLGFDYANEVNFRTFPNDGTEATYCFVANQWQDDSHDYYKPAGVRLKKADQVSEISDEDILNAGEGDQRWVPTNLACRGVDIITDACLQDPSCSYGVSLGDNGSDVPIWIKGNACVAGELIIEPPIRSSSSSTQGIISAQWSQFRIDTSNDFCICARSFSFTPVGAPGGIETFSINNGGAKFSTCTTFDRDIYTKEKVYLTELPTYSGSADPENTSLVTKSYVDSRLSSVYSFKGTKAKKSDLNSVATKAKGDVYNVTEDGMNYAWDGTAWDALGGDFSRYYTKTEIDTKLGDYYTKTSADNTFASLSGQNTFKRENVFEYSVSNEGTVFFCTSHGGKLRFTNDSYFIDLKQSSSGTSLCILDGGCLSDSHPYVSLSNRGITIGYQDPYGETLCTELNQTYVKTGSLALSSFYSTASGNFGNGRVITIDVADPMLSIGSFVQPLIHLKLGNTDKNVAIPWREPAEYSLVADTDLADYPSKEEVYDRATIDGVTTGANVLPKMNEVIGYLEDYEEKTGEKLPLELYEETVKAIDEWQKDPTVEKTWNTSSDGTSTNPYYAEAPKKPVVDLSVVQAKGVNTLYPSFSLDTDVDLFLPASTDISQVIRAGTRFNNYLICPNATIAYAALYKSTSFNKPLYLKSATDCSYLLTDNKKFNSFAILPNCKKATEAFSNTAMSAENISRTLDSLPSGTSATSVIKFTGSPGASELTQESPSVAAAVAKGWSVLL